MNPDELASKREVKIKFFPDKGTLAGSCLKTHVRGKKEKGNEGRGNKRLRTQRLKPRSRKGGFGCSS